MSKIKFWKCFLVLVFHFLFPYSVREATLLSSFLSRLLLKLWRCVSDLLTTCRDFWKGLEIEWGAEGVNFIRLYFTTVFYLERGLTSFYVRNSEPNFSVKNNGICLTFEFLEFLFFSCFTFVYIFHDFFKICRRKLSVNKYQIDS